jgi:hypothetical protein
MCWRWSDVSVADAQQKADARAAELDRLVASGRKPDRYGYTDRPHREEILEQQPGFAITRNAYGAQVLNTERAMFVDVDFDGDDRREPRALDQLRRWAGQHGLGATVYRTAAGLRALVTSATFDPKAPATAALLQGAGCDPLYVKLCQAQSSFRARLTPKPWRIDLRPPHTRWPFSDESEAERHRAWVEQYEDASRAFAACRFVEAIGPGAIDPAVQPVFAIHAQRATGSERLA